MRLFRRLIRPAGLDGVEAVRGERGLPSVRQSVSLQARISNFLAMALMLAMGAAILTGYYLHTAKQHAQMRQQAQASAGSRAQTEMALPALGFVAAPDTAQGGAAPIPLAPAPAMTPAVAGAGVPLLPNAMPIYGAVPAPMPDRRLSGAAFERAAPAVDGAAAGSARPESATGSAMSGAAAGGPNAPTAGAIATLLRSEPTGATSAHALPTQRLLLPKGAFIDCTLETAIDSTLPGMTTCVTASDTFGVDGKVVLLERGTKLVGETRGQVQQGTARLFVLWTEARTPTGVIVPLDSPAADELGRAGLAGTVERHFWERFGAALFISTIDGAVQAAVQSSNHGNGTVIYNPSATQDVATEVLKSTLNIAPTVRKDNGDRIQILVARDVDFAGVYELRGAGL
jgi:type IV secretion system protein VirB10